MRLIDNLIKSVLPGNEIVGGSISTLVKGSVAAMLITFVAQPILTHLFTPEAFGTFDIFMSVLAVLTPWATLRYQDAIMLPDKDEEASEIAWLSVSILFVYTAALLIVFLPTTPISSAILSKAPGVPVALLPAALFVFMLIQQGEIWASRKQRFRIVSRNAIAQGVTTASSRITAGVANPAMGALGLIGGLLLGFAVNAAMYARQIKDALSFRPSVAGMRSAAARYRRFPLFSLPANAINAFRTKLPFFVLLLFFGEETVGLFGRAVSVIGVPLGVAAIAIGRAFFSYGARTVNTRKILPLTNDVYWLILAFGFFPTVAVIISGPEIFSAVFGGNWRTAGVYAQIISPWLLVAGLASPFTRLFDIYEKQNIEFSLSILLVLTQGIVLYIGGKSGDVFTTLILLSIAGFVVRFLQIGIAQTLAGASATSILRPWVFAALTAIPGSLLLVAAKTLSSDWFAVAAAILGIGAAYWIAVKLSPRVRLANSQDGE